MVSGDGCSPLARRWGSYSAHSDGRAWTGRAPLQVPSSGEGLHYLHFPARGFSPWAPLAPEWRYSPGSTLGSGSQLHFFRFDISGFICHLLHRLAREVPSAATTLNRGVLVAKGSLRVRGLRAWLPSCSSPSRSCCLFHALSVSRDQLPAGHS